MFIILFCWALRSLLGPLFRASIFLFFVFFCLSLTLWGYNSSTESLTATQQHNHSSTIVYDVRHTKKAAVLSNQFSSLFVFVIFDFLFVISFFFLYFFHVNRISLGKLSVLKMKLPNVHDFWTQWTFRPLKWFIQFSVAITVQIHTFHIRPFILFLFFSLSSLIFLFSSHINILILSPFHKRIIISLQLPTFYASSIVPERRNNWKISNEKKQHAQNKINEKNERREDGERKLQKKEKWRRENEITSQCVAWYMQWKYVLMKYVWTFNLVCPQQC